MGTKKEAKGPHQIGLPMSELLNPEKASKKKLEKITEELLLEEENQVRTLYEEYLLLQALDAERD